MPGHKRNPLAVDGDFPVERDITEINGFDNLHHAEDILKRAQEDVARLYGVPESFYSINGSSGAILAAVSAAVDKGGQILVARNCHKAVYHAIYLRDLGATYIYPHEDPKLGINGGISPSCVEMYLAENPEIEAVLITSPTYDGIVSDVAKIAEVAHHYGVPLIVDASQSAGILPINMKSLGAAYIAMPGHKGLYGPQGTGVLLCGDGQIPRPLQEGGTGSISLSQEMPDFLPDRIEAGTHNMPGIAGLLAGVRFVRRQGTQAILRHEHALTCRTAESLRRLPGVEVLAHPGCLAQAGVVSFRVPGRDAETVGEALARRGIAVRAGLHCAPLAHRTAGTLDTGTVRVSFSAFNTPQEADRLAEAVGDILRR